MSGKNIIDYERYLTIPGYIFGIIWSLNIFNGRKTKI